MQECDTLSLRAQAGFLVNELNAGPATALERGVKIVDREADVMNPRPALFQETRDRGFCFFRLEELHQHPAGAESSYVSSVGVIERDLAQTEHIAKERKASGESFHSDADVRYPRSARG